jgi:hypothetical protein
VRAKGTTSPASTSPPQASLDPRIPQMARLLDSLEMRPVLQRALGDDAHISNVRGRYLRYKPGTNLVVHYELDIENQKWDASALVAASADLAARAAKPANATLARIASLRSVATKPLSYDPETRALIQFWPLEIKLPALARPPAQLIRALVDAGMPPVADSRAEPARLAYKPRRRAVLRFGDHVVKIYARDDHFTSAWSSLERISTMDVATARAEAAVAELRVTAQEWLAGSDLGPPRAMAHHAGRFLQRLHGSAPEGLVAFPARRQLDIAAASARLVTTIAPELGDLVRRLVCELEHAMPSDGPLVVSHGDYHSRQLLGLASGIGAIDFDGMRAAANALDPATFAAHVVRGRPGDLQHAASVLDALVEGYGGRPRNLAWYWATSILRRSPFPFRDLDVRWPEKVARMVHAARAALTL